MKIHIKKTGLFFLCLTNLIGYSLSANSQTFLQQNFGDFVKGELDAAGQNIYVSRKEGIRTIRRFDLNDDGFIDLLFNSTHNDDVAVPASVTTISRNRQMDSKEIQVEGSLSAEVADLNLDGYPDVVFCPNPTGVQTPHRYVTILWGGNDGWPSQRSNGILPVNGAKSVVVADLNGDQWPDIVTLNSEAWLPNQPKGNIVRVFWGGRHGFMLTRFKDFGIEKAFKLVSGDFDDNGALDVAALTANNTIHVLWAEDPLNRHVPISDRNKIKPAEMNVSDLAEEKEIKVDLKTTEIKLPEGAPLCITAADADGDGRTDLLVGSKVKSIYIFKSTKTRMWQKVKTIPNVEASSITVRDIDGDKNPDIIISQFSLLHAAGGEMLGGKSTDSKNISILWGSSGDFSSVNRFNLEAPYTVATTIADVDGDGHMDIICARHQGEKTYKAESPIFFGKGNREFERSEKGIPTSGAYHVAIIPPGKNHTASIVMSNSRAGNLKEEVPLFLYWGSAKGFNKKNHIEIPFSSGYESSAADLNEDGFVDLIAINSMHGGEAENPYRGVNIFWGSKDGFDFAKRRTVLNEENASTSNVADLNKDGYLDIVVGFFDHVATGVPTRLVIYYGSEKGFEQRNRVSILSEGRSTSPTIGDYNKDGWLDIAVSSYTKSKLRIFWGSKEGYKESAQQILNVPAILDLETADLNKDGYLDLVACTYKDHVNNHHDTGVLLFWGGPEGFKEWNAQSLPAFTAVGPVVSDFDSDGYLDLFFPSYHGDNTRESLPMYLYWGGVNGFNTHNRTVLIGDSGADALAADFNHDGKIDLAVANHATDGYHSKAVSQVYYNDGKRFTSRDMNVEYLPTPGSHWMWNYDLGNIYTRKSEQSYVSPEFILDQGVKLGKINFEADSTRGTSLVFSVRTAIKKELLKDGEWREVKTSEFNIPSNDRFFQYKALLCSGNGDKYPILKKVKVVIK